MFALAELYPAVQVWLQAFGGIPHAASVTSLAQMVTAVLLGQSLRSSARADLPECNDGHGAASVSAGAASDDGWSAPIGVFDALAGACGAGAGP